MSKLLRQAMHVHLLLVDRRHRVGRRLKDVTCLLCTCLRLSLTLRSLSMESLTSSGYRAVAETVVAWRWRPLATLPVTHGIEGSRFETSYQRHWGSKGLRPQGVMAMSIRRSRRSGSDATGMGIRNGFESNVFKEWCYFGDAGNKRQDREGSTRQAKVAVW